MLCLNKTYIIYFIIINCVNSLLTILIVSIYSYICMHNLTKLWFQNAEYGTLEPEYGTEYGTLEPEYGTEYGTRVEFPHLHASRVINPSNPAIGSEKPQFQGEYFIISQ